MGVLPLTYKPGESRESLGLDGSETFDVATPADLKAGQDIAVTATKADGTAIEFTATCRVDTPVEVEYYRHGGILQYVLRRLLKA